MRKAPLIVGAVCARGGSKGIPRKNLQLIRGVPLIVHTIRQARASSMLHRVVVSTDDEEIAAVARDAGAEVPFLRPASLAQADTSKWLVFRHLVNMVESQENVTVDILVDLDTGVPLRSVADIDGCINLFLREEVDVVVTAYKAERNPYFNMIEIQPNGYARISKPLQKPIVGRQLAPEVFSLTPSVYVISREALFHYDHWSQARMKIYPVPRKRAVDIDEEIDLKFVRFLMESDE